MGSQQCGIIYGRHPFQRLTQQMWDKAQCTARPGRGQLLPSRPFFLRGKRACPPIGQVVSPAARRDEQSPKASGSVLGIKSWKETCTTIPASILNSP